MQAENKKKYSVSERFNQLLEYLGISRYKMSKETGISETVLQNISEGKNMPSIKITVKLLSTYKMVNADWWLLGEGEMLKKDSTKEAIAVDTNPIESEVLFLRERLTQMHNDNSALIRTLENMSSREMQLLYQTSKSKVNERIKPESGNGTDR